MLKYICDIILTLQDRALELKHDLWRNLEIVQDYSALLNTYSSSINQSQFSTFGQSSAWNASEMRHLIFRPRVDHSKRSQWEQDHNQTIVTPGMDGKPVRAPDNDVYYPTTFKLYAEEPQPWSGYDLYLPTNTRLALQRVQATRNPTLTDAISLVNQKKGAILL
ncbi:hypothetical protein BKA69DRAFT_411775 [Paraphysoderma sedebokerense]|nr:hypothetical protein BKA69DRAFT_411775 [Paraphysoderma sedebokerense]